MQTKSCPALLVSAPSSHSGKTTVTAALARYWTQQGKTVRVFKTGPDFLDPMLLEQASSAPVHQLDLWMMGEDNCRRRLAEAAQEADLILIEGVMGLYDGHTSSADIARLFDIPLLLVVDGSAMAQTFGALVYGLANYQPDLKVFGVVANRVNSAGHARYLQQSLPDGIHFCGYMPSNDAITLPERHLGLVQAAELPDLDKRLDLAAEQLASHGALLLPPASEFSYPISNKTWNDGLNGVTIAVAHDAAFSFIYRDNLQLLQQMGAQLRFFSPISDQTLPDADALYLPGGYPELYIDQLADNQSMLHAIRAHVQADKPTVAECGGMLYLPGGYPELYIDQLADNQSMLHAIRAHVQADKPTVAECGGMLYLLNGLTDKDGHRRDLLGVLPGEALMETRLAGLGVLSAQFPFGEVRGHTFHFSSSQIRVAAEREAQHPVHGSAEPVYQQGRLLASYVHWYLGDQPEACMAWFKP